MKKNSKFILIAIFNFITLNSFAQNKFNVSIEFLPKIDTEKLSIYIDNGKEAKKYKTIFIENKTKLIGDFYSKYATIIITYRGKSEDVFYLKKFWINENKASIKFNNGDTTINFLNFNKIIGAFNLEDMGEKKFKNFISNEQLNFDDFLKENQNFNSDTLKQKIFKLKAHNLNEKKMSFIKLYPKLYYSVYILRGLASYFYSDPILLKKMFVETFSQKIKDSFEGLEILKTLNGRILKLGNAAPYFSAKSINGRIFSTNDFKNKYLLLVFWASWCGPCIEELPILKEISINYNQKNLEILFITLDENYNKFNNAIKKYEMNWDHIYGDKELVKTFGVTGIPQIYLINEKNQIIYIRQKNEESGLDKLKEILKSKI